MGGSASSAPLAQAAVPGSSVEDVVRMVMPLYYTQQPISPQEYEAASHVWKLITRNQCKAFQEAKAADPSIHCKIATEYMHQIFYARLFDVHPTCRPLFSRSVNKMNLVPMISMCLSKLEANPEALKSSLHNLVRVHNKLGIKAGEYGLAGEVLIFAIRKVSGPIEFTTDAHNGWLKIYSAMLEIIVPEVVRFEIEHKEEAIAIQKKRTGNPLSGASSSLASLTTIVLQDGATNAAIASGGVSVRSLMTHKSAASTATAVNV